MPAEDKHENIGSHIAHLSSFSMCRKSPPVPLDEEVSHVCVSVVYAIRYGSAMKEMNRQSVSKDALFGRHMTLQYTNHGYLVGGLERPGISQLRHPGHFCSVCTYENSWSRIRCGHLIVG